MSDRSDDEHSFHNDEHLDLNQEELHLNLNDLADLENLAENLNNIDIQDNHLVVPDNNNQNQINMANYQLIKMYIDTLPVFDGNPYTLNIFLEACQQLINTHHGDQAQNAFLLRAILSKLQGRALMLIG